MIYQIKNQNLSVEVNSLGAELWSIKDGAGHEYLWQGDENTWKNRATNLFPFCGRMTKGIYRFQGKEYEMMIHGFAKGTEFSLVEQSDHKLVLAMEDSPATYQIYPFRFRLFISYELVDNKLNQAYMVENMDDQTMYFAVGGHPGFQIPMEAGLSFQDYEILFEKERVDQILLSADYFMTEDRVACPAIEKGKMALRHDLFDRDAIILTDMGQAVTIHSPKGKAKIRVSFPDMSYLALWHRPFTQAGFVCIEPWTSLPARQDVVEDLEHKADLKALKPGELYQNHWQIEIIN